MPSDDIKKKQELVDRISRSASVLKNLGGLDDGLAGVFDFVRKADIKIAKQAIEGKPPSLDV